MAAASYVQPNFLGGELSSFAQGRFDKPEYRTSMNVCFNSFPVEIGPWTRRPGSRFAGTTRAGLNGRVIKFDFEQATPYTLEFTDSVLRFRSGATVVTTNDAQSVVGISTATPAVVETLTPHGWSDGNSVSFSALGATAPLLQNREFIIDAIDTTHFSISDEITGAGIDGSTLGAISAAAMVSRVQELATPYAGLAWSSVRTVQAETTDILLSPKVPPQALVVSSLPSDGVSATFTLNPAVFNDGPYLDPFENGVQVTPDSISGLVTLTLSFDDYDEDKAYPKDSFVTDSGTNYVSLADQNVGNSPATSPSFWDVTPASAAIGPSGFQGSDVGRLVRLLSEPPAWSPVIAYGVGTTVTYNPSGNIGAGTYWISLVGSTGVRPGSNLTTWQLVPQGAAIWTWGKIVSLSTIIDRSLMGSVAFGTMFQAGGVAAAFNGAFSQGRDSSAMVSTSGGLLPPFSSIGVNGSVGKNYTANPQQISQATVYAPASGGFAFGSYYEQFTGVAYAFPCNVLLNLRASMTAPINAADGTLLGTTGFFANNGQAQTITSNNQVTAFNYVWIEIVATSQTWFFYSQAWNLFAVIGQVSFYGPPGTGTSDGVVIEVLGAPLLYTAPISTWRLGAYSNTTGWPTCGTYHEGRLWLGGAVPNRFDACVSNGIVGGTINFAPTDLYGVVSGNNAISYVLNSDSVNPIFWFQPDLQGIIIGTQAGEWLVQAPANGAIAPTNIAARRVTKNGCANVEPRRTENTTVFVQRYSKKLMEYFADVYSGKFSAPNLADKAQHITRAGIAELAYQQAATPIIWGRDNNNALFGITYKRETLTTAQGPTYAGWHRHALGSGRVVNSICSGPSVGGNLDTLTMVTSDPITLVYHVELLTDTLDEDSDLASAWFLDGAVTPSSTVETSTPGTGSPYGGLTLNGLWHLNGKTVSVFAGGLDCGTHLVDQGSTFVPFGDGVSAGTGNGLFTSDFLASFADGCPIVVGFNYISQGQLIRPVSPADSGARNGPAFGKKRRNHRYAAQLDNTIGLKIGTKFTDMYPMIFRDEGDKELSPLSMFSGIQFETIQDDYSFDGMICWETTGPFPATIVAIGGNIQTQDE